MRWPAVGPRFRRPRATRRLHRADRRRGRPTGRQRPRRRPPHPPLKHCSTCSSTTSSRRRRHHDPHTDNAPTRSARAAQRGDGAHGPRTPACSPAPAHRRAVAGPDRMHRMVGPRRRRAPHRFRGRAGRPRRVRPPAPRPRRMEQIDGQHWVDGLNEAARAVPNGREDAPGAWERHSAAALKARRRMPAPIRALPLLPIGTGLGAHIGWQPRALPVRLGFTRDVWMHRIDIARAAGIEAGADPRARRPHPRRHRRRSGRAGTGSPTPHTHRTGRRHLPRRRRRPGQPAQRVDAVEFAAIISGRVTGTGILRTSSPRHPPSTTPAKGEQHHAHHRPSPRPTSKRSPNDSPMTSSTPRTTTAR